MVRGMAMAAALSAFAAGAAAGQTATDLVLGEGTAGAVVPGALTGDAWADLRVVGTAGQLLMVDLDVGATDGDGTVYFNILPPGSDDVAIWIGSMEPDRSAEVQLAEDGTYTIRTYLMGNDRDAGRRVAYNLSVELR